MGRTAYSRIRYTQFSWLLTGEPSVDGLVHRTTYTPNPTGGVCLESNKNIARII